MFEKIKNLLGLTSQEEKIKKYLEVEENLSIVKSEIDNLAKDYTERDKEYKEAIESSPNEFVKGRIKERYHEFITEHMNDISDVKLRYDKLNKEMNSLLQDENLQKAIKESKSCDNQVEKAQYTDEQKAKIAKVMREFKAGKLKSSSGQIVTDHKQAVAIALSEAGISKAQLDDLVKARSGVYKDTPYNRKHGLVGQRYGGNKKDEGFKKLVHVDKDWAESEKDKVVNSIKSKLKDNYKVVGSNVSTTNGLSIYVSVLRNDEDKPFTFRISDHDSGLKRGKINETSFDYKVQGADLDLMYHFFGDLSKDDKRNSRLNLIENALKKYVSLNRVDSKAFELLSKEYKEITGKEYAIEKSETYNSLLYKGGDLLIDENGHCIGFSESLSNELFKGKDLSKLVRKEVWVKRKDGKTFKQTVYVKGAEEFEPEPGQEITPTVKGMDIERYSEKALIIKGDTKSNVDLLRKIKEALNVGNWNRKLNGWIFPYKYKEDILGMVYSDLVNKGEDEKAQAVQNQKNEFDAGTKVSIEGNEGEIKKGASDSDGIKYDIKLKDGGELKGVDEKALNVQPEKDDNKIADAVNNATPASRVKTEKILFGVKPITDIHNYSLSEYMGMHGISEEDIQKVIDRLKNPKKEGEGKRSGGGGSTTPREKKEGEGLTKQQLISKLLYNHYQAVKKAIEEGKELKPEALELYAELKESYDKKRKELTEEHKRKISEALKKDKTEEQEEEGKKTPQQEAQDFINSMSQEELNSIKDAFVAAKNEFTEKEQSKLAEMIVEKEKLQKEYYGLHKQANSADDYTEKNKLKDQARKISPQVNKLEKQIRNQSNKVQALNNWGTLSTITDETGMKHESVPDFRMVDATDISYTIDNILTEERPKYIPEINEDTFRQKGFILDAIRVNKDSYMVAVNGHSEKGEFLGYSSKTGKNEYDKPDFEGNGYVILTLDQLVLTNDYYTTKQKAVYKQKADEKSQRELDAWDKKSDEQKEKYINYYGVYPSLPAKLKKQFTKEQWGGMTWQEKEKHFKPVKKYNPERLKSQLSDGKMWASFHDMHQRFVDISATPFKKERFSDKTIPLKLGEAAGNYGHPKAFKAWNEFSEMLNWKINDINIQREEYSDIRKKALETSFGESNTNDTLLAKDGILVKRQNGEQIKPQEIEQLEKAWGEVQKSFGSLKENARADGLKLSHTGKTLIYASKAIGVYVPTMKTIAVSNKFGEETLGLTLGHETAHWIDHTLGKKEGKRYASDNFESTAGQIAISFRRGLNEKSKSDYTNSTKECFARALEQYHAIELYGENAQMTNQGRYFASEDYVNKNTYETQLKPLIKQFLEENKEILKALGADNFFKADGEKLTKKEVNYTYNAEKGLNKCANCTFYSGERVCTKVEGEIAKNGWCELHKKKIESIKKSINTLLDKFGQDKAFGILEKSNLFGELNTDKEKANFNAFLDVVKELYLTGDINSDNYENFLEKARTGVYSDNAQNRRLKRVGQKYGSKGTDEPTNKKEPSNEPENGKKEGADLTEQAKEASVGQLEAAIKESGSAEVRQAAHNELDRREKEEKVTPESEKKFGEDYEKEKKQTEDNAEEKEKPSNEPEEETSVKEDSPDINKKIDFFETKAPVSKLRLGRSGKSILKTSVNPSQTSKGLKTWLKSNDINYSYNKAKTTASHYFQWENEDGDDFNVRVSNHSKADIEPDKDFNGIQIHKFPNGSVSVDIDSYVGHTSTDIKNIVQEIDQNKNKFTDQVNKLSIEDIYNNKYTPSNLVSKINIGEDYYGVKSELVIGDILLRKNSKKYKDFVADYEKKQKDKEKDFNEKVVIDGISIDFSLRGKEPFVEINKEPDSNWTKTGRKNVQRLWYDQRDEIKDHSDKEAVINKVKKIIEYAKKGVNNVKNITKSEETNQLLKDIQKWL